VKRSESKEFQNICDSLQIPLPQNSLEKFELYLEELGRWNKKINLISRKSDKPQDIYKHILDSLLIFKAIEIPKEAFLLDIGSGAGFPGVPIKIVRDDIYLTLLESKRKKAFFLEQILKLLSLKKVEVINQRLEELLRNTKFVEKYDIVTVKGVGDLKKIIPLSLPFLKKGGLFVAYKGGKGEEELASLPLSSDYKIEKDLLFNIPEFNLSRWLLVISRCCALKKFVKRK
jgi:16S rRNA (guanine527-N7)-methyltransferase